MGDLCDCQGFESIDLNIWLYLFYLLNLSSVQPNQNAVNIRFIKQLAATEQSLRFKKIGLGSKLSLDLIYGLSCCLSWVEDLVLKLGLRNYGSSQSFKSRTLSQYRIA